MHFRNIPSAFGIKAIAALYFGKQTSSGLSVPTNSKEIKPKLQFQSFTGFRVASVLSSSYGALRRYASDAHSYSSLQKETVKASDFTFNYCWVSMNEGNFERTGKVIFLDITNVEEARMHGFKVCCPIFLSRKIQEDVRREMMPQAAKDFGGEVVDFMEILKQDIEDERLSTEERMVAKNLFDLINQIDNPDIQQEKDQLPGQICFIVDLMKLYMASKERQVGIDFNVEVTDADKVVKSLHASSQQDKPYFSEGELGEIENKINFNCSYKLIREIIESLSDTFDIYRLSRDTVFSVLYNTLKNFATKRLKEIDLLNPEQVFAYNLSTPKEFIFPYDTYSYKKENVHKDIKKGKHLSRLDGIIR